MILSWNWLQDYVQPGVSVADFALRMMLAGFNHESSTPVGQDFAVDLEITSNRPDCLGHIGLAREAAVLWNQSLRIPAAQLPVGKTPLKTLARVELAAPDLCPRYIARVIRGVQVGPSPTWLVERLATLGIKSINNLVDITNFVLMECGQPLHAFDLAKLRGGQIIVRRANTGETIAAIDHLNYKLTPEMCVIADQDRPVAIAGIMGGAETEITPSTTEVLIEAALFDPLSVRTTSRALALRSDSSYRFERGLDPAGVDWASRRCCELILQLAGGELAEGAITVGPTDPEIVPVTLRLAQIPRVLGIDVPTATVRQILTQLGLREISHSESALTVAPPSWRRDLTREIDLIEEVARIYGYEKIPEDRAVPLVPSARTAQDRVISKIRTVLVGAGFDEALTLSAVEEAASQAFSPWCAAEPLQTGVPVLRRADRLRRSLIPSLLIARRINESLANATIELFETAKVYWPQPADGRTLPAEELLLALCGGGDFLEVKGLIEACLARLNPRLLLQVKSWNDPLFAPGRGAELFLAGPDGQPMRVGVLGEISKTGLKSFELRSATTVAELRLAPLIDAAILIPTARELSPYPSVSRDINLVVAESVRWDDVAGTVRGHAGPNLERLEYRDTWRDATKLGQGLKSLLFSLHLRGQTATLTSGEADAVCEQVVAACKDRHQAELRT
ncbi:MAG: phenylalanine--tRNA ligase subunit beta [Pirellulales bacterium]|nr:phenylalanine--tRNA ligase subunit beta [Pirellulales bacterium]